MQVGRDGKKGKLETLEEKLYSRSPSPEVSSRDNRLERSGATPAETADSLIEVPASPDSKIEQLSVRKRTPLMRFILIFSIIFFIVAAGMAFFIFYRGENVVSTGNVNIDVSGPLTVRAGDELILDIDVTNRNNTRLESVRLSINYPEGTKDSTDFTKDLLRVHEDIGALEPSERVTKTVRSVLFGEEGSEKEVDVSLEYRLAGSNAIFQKVTIYTVRVSSSPVTLRVDSLEAASTGQELELTISVASNSTSVVKNLLLVAHYPFGFRLKSTEPRPSVDPSSWRIGDLPQEARRVVKIRGYIEGREGEEKTFRFALGTVSPRNDQEIGTVMLRTQKTVSIERPFIGVTLALDGDSGSADFISSMGRTIRADILWVNNLSERVTGAEITVRLSGVALNKNSVVVQDGFYRSTDNVLIWNEESKEDLASLSPGQSGTTSFTFASLTGAAAATLRNPELTMDISVRGRRLSESGVPETVSSTLLRKVKFSSELAITARIVYSLGPFQNSGPVPPRAEKETTYTIILSLTNTVNPLSNVSVRGKLPSYVRWIERVSPEQERLTFNSFGGEINWEVGELKASTGTGSSAVPPREVAFQVLLLPSLSQIGTVPLILTDIQAKGLERYTGRELEDSHLSLSTKISTDPIFTTGIDIVAQ